jgi:hypothetical protein
VLSGALRKDADVSYCAVPLAASLDVVRSRLAAWYRASSIPMTIRGTTAYFALNEEVNAKTCVDDMWVARDGSQLQLRMYCRGLAGPYQLQATLLGKSTWIEAMAQPAERFDFFLPGSTGAAALQGDMLSPACTGCGLPVPLDLFGAPWEEYIERCPRCMDERAGLVVAGLPRAITV